LQRDEGIRTAPTKLVGAAPDVGNWADLKGRLAGEHPGYELDCDLGGDGAASAFSAAEFANGGGQIIGGEVWPALV
jgi:hypothetical protein